MQTTPRQSAAEVCVLAVIKAGRVRYIQATAINPRNATTDLRPCSNPASATTWHIGSGQAADVEAVMRRAGMTPANGFTIERRTFCGYCGDAHPMDRSCSCYDNHSE